MTALAIGAWLEELYELSIFAVAVSSLLSWPFAALTGYFRNTFKVYIENTVTLNLEKLMLMCYMLELGF
jgi:hypothetical protein